MFIFAVLVKFLQQDLTQKISQPYEFSQAANFRNLANFRRLGIFASYTVPTKYRKLRNFAACTTHVPVFGFSYTHCSLVLSFMIYIYIYIKKIKNFVSHTKNIYRKILFFYYF